MIYFIFTVVISIIVYRLGYKRGRRNEALLQKHPLHSFGGFMVMAVEWVPRRQIWVSPLDLPEHTIRQN